MRTRRHLGAQPVFPARRGSGSSGYRLGCCGWIRVAATENHGITKAAYSAGATLPSAKSASQLWPGFSGEGGGAWRRAIRAHLLLAGRGSVAHAASLFQGLGGIQHSEQLCGITGHARNLKRQHASPLAESGSERRDGLARPEPGLVGLCGARRRLSGTVYSVFRSMTKR